MALKDNIVTAEVKANGYGGVDTDRLAKSIDQIALTYEFKNEQAEGGRRVRRLVPAVRGRPQGELSAREFRRGSRVRVRRA